MRIINSGALIGTVRRSCQPLMFSYISNFSQKKAVFNSGKVHNLIRKGAGMVEGATRHRGVTFFTGIIHRRRIKRIKSLKKRTIFLLRSPGGRLTNIRRHFFFYKRRRGRRMSKIVPDVIVALDQTRSKTHTMSVGQQLRIPTISIVNSNVNPNRASYPLTLSNNSTNSRTSVVIYFMSAAFKGKFINISRQLPKFKLWSAFKKRKKKWKKIYNDLKEFKAKQKLSKPANIKQFRALKKLRRKNDKTFLK